MANRFTEQAKKSLGGSPVLANRKKLSVDDVIAEFPDGVEVDEFDILAGDRGEYPVFHIKGTDNYFNGGAMALTVARGWASMFDGDIERASEELKIAGGAKFIMTHGKTAKGNPIVRFDPVE